MDFVIIFHIIVVYRVKYTGWYNSIDACHGRGLLQHLMQKLVLCEKEKADGKNEATELRHQLDRLRDDNAKLHSMMQNMNSFGETDALKAKVHSLTEEAKRLSQEKSTLSQQLIDFRRDTNHEIEVRYQHEQNRSVG